MTVAKPLDMRCSRTRDGYPTVRLDGRTQNLHKVIAETFLGPAPFEGAVTRHLNDIPDDNRVENLAWGTRSQNGQDAVRNGRLVHPRGEAHARSRLTEARVREIRAWATYGFTQKDIAAWYGVARETVHGIVRRRKWRHVDA